MGLPRYWINMEDMVDSLVPKEGSGRLEMGVTRSKGFRIVADIGESYSESWESEVEIVLTGLKVSGSAREHGQNHILGSFDFYIGEEIVFESVNMKDIYQYKKFKIFKLIEENTELRFVYRQLGDDEGEVWVDIDYITDFRRERIKGKSKNR